MPCALKILFDICTTGRIKPTGPPSSLDIKYSAQLTERGNRAVWMIMHYRRPFTGQNGIGVAVSFTELPNVQINGKFGSALIPVICYTCLDEFRSFHNAAIRRGWGCAGKVCTLIIT